MPTELQKVDIFTKAFSATRFCFLGDKLFLKESYSGLWGHDKEFKAADVDKAS